MSLRREPSPSIRMARKLKKGIAKGIISPGQCDLFGEEFDLRIILTNSMGIDLGALCQP